MSIFTEGAAMAVVAGLGYAALTQGTAVAVPDAVGMRLTELTYQDGNFVQAHEIYGTDALAARWSAQITRGATPLCQGEGPGVYERHERSVMDVDTWVGDACPPLAPGDRAIAVWSWVDENGTVNRISGEVLIDTP